jgi:spoIIIJ-associated protein
MTTSTSDRAADTLRKLLTTMGLEAEVVATEDEERVTLEVRGPETGLVIGKKGQTLDALQYLVNKIVSRGLSEPGSEGGKPINVDAEGYRSRRAESLVELAHRLAEKARRTGKPVAADPMSPADRRVIHVALAGQPGLTTRSEGEGIYRHLVIIPTGDSAGE